MKIFNTLTRQLEEFEPINPEVINIYVCGPTVYDDAHLGHARCYIIWDVVTRYLRFKGYKLNYIRNITDVDDKIINKAKSLNISPDELTKKYIKCFEQDMSLINVKTPDIQPKATEYIQDMIDFIEKLVDNGNAYVKDGDVYFKVESYKNYGELSNQKINDLISGARVEADEKKENPLDFALWKAIKNKDEVSWKSPWGNGRPGWHTECCAMINRLVGPVIDIHAGGYDLVFPHHENERAQVESLTGKSFVKYWMHNGFVNVDAEKMSKSLGNFKTIKELTKTYDSNTIRLFILTNHYRMPVDFTDEALSSAKKGIKRIKKSVIEMKKIIEKYPEDVLKAHRFADEMLGKIIRVEMIDGIKSEFAHFAENLCTEELCASSPWIKNEFSAVIWRIKEFIASMDNDFNTSKALAILFDMSSMVQKNKNKLDYSHGRDMDILNILTFETIVLEKLANVLGFEFVEETEEKDDSDISNNLMEIIIKIRKKAREDKNWALADTIRDELKALNIIVEDNKDGTTTWSINKE